MDRSEILEMMAALQLSGMRAAYDEIVSTGIKRKHSVDQIIAALLKAEIAEKQARSIRYQMGVAKLPLAKELADFVFKGTPINEQLDQAGTEGALLQCGGSGQPARGRDQGGSWRSSRREVDAHRPGRHRRARLSAVCAIWRPAAVPP